MASYYVTSKTCAIKGATERAYGSGALMSLDMPAGVSWMPGEPTILLTASRCLSLPPATSCLFLLLRQPRLRASQPRPSPPLKQYLSTSRCIQKALTPPQNPAAGARKQMLQRNRPLLKRQGFASTASPRCRFFAAIAPATQRAMTPHIT